MGKVAARMRVEKYRVFSAKVVSFERHLLGIKKILSTFNPRDFIRNIIKYITK